MAERSAASTLAAVQAPVPAWHSAAHMQARKLMMKRLREHPALAQHHPILQAREEGAGAGTGTGTGSSTRPSLLQRLEWMLYHAAGSMNEYLHGESLERRVQALVTHYKRKRSESELDVDRLTAEAARPRRIPRITKEDVDAAVTFGSRGCILNGNVDLLRHVCSFLDGRDVLRCRAVDKFLYVHAPSFVRSLHLDASTALSPFSPAPGCAMGLCELLQQCENLVSLTVSNCENLKHLKAGVVFPRALTAASYAASLSRSSYGCQLVREVSRALEGGACRALETLELRAPFDFATESDASLMALRSLASSHATYGRKALRHLVLDSAFLGDRGVAELMALLKSSGACFSQLETLGLRNNFVGESGYEHLLEGFDSLRALQTLDLSRNILTDADAMALADMLDKPVDTVATRMDQEHGQLETGNAGIADGLSLPALRTLMLQDNFISCDGFHAITIALCARRDFVAAASGAVNPALEQEEAGEEEEEEEEEAEGLMDIEE